MFNRKFGKKNNSGYIGTVGQCRKYVSLTVTKGHYTVISLVFGRHSLRFLGYTGTKHRWIKVLIQRNNRLSWLGLNSRTTSYRKVKARNLFFSLCVLFNRQKSSHQCPVIRVFTVINIFLSLLHIWWLSIVSVRELTWFYMFVTCIYEATWIVTQS